MANQPPLEDQVEDILEKAAAGLGMGKRRLASETGLTPEKIGDALSGKGDEDTLLQLAECLRLHGPSLVALARGKVQPPSVKLAGLSTFTTPYPVPGYEEMTVNAYLLQKAGEPAGILFDAGASAEPVLAGISERRIRIEAIFLTHTHGDHVKALPALLEGNAPPVHVPEKEPFEKALPFAAGKSFQVAGLSVGSRLTSGHSPGGTTYVVAGLDQPVAIVGDALFCCSQGGAGSAYPEALEANRKAIFSLPDETILCPGHGPLTTVAFEKAHNPFYPEFK